MTKIYLISVLFTAFFFVKCSEQEPIIEYITITETVVKNVRETVEVELNPYEESTLQRIISADLTLDPTKIWLLKGRVAVEEGITLTIPAGTIIKAAAGTGADASTLIISRGAKIMAEGTLENPIIMTSISDNIELGGTYTVNGPSLTVESRGLWGGLLILGNAPCSFSGDVTELQIVVVLPMLAGLTWAMTALSTRYLCGAEDTVTLLFWFFFALGVLGAIGLGLMAIGLDDGRSFVSTGWRSPTFIFWKWTIVQAVFSMIAVSMLTRAYQVGNASYIAVFEYSFLISASLWAWVLFGDGVDFWGMVGIAMIILSGAVIALRRSED